MNRVTIFVSALVFWNLSSGSALTQMRGMDMPMQIGRVEFLNSCSPRVKKHLDLGVAALYSFWFAESHQLFERVAKEEPDCAIAFWGVAMSDYEQIEGRSLPEGPQLADGLRAIAKGKAAIRKTPREAAYINAVANIFDEGPTTDHDQRVQRFSAAMGAVSSAYPSDREAAVIYAMSLLKDGMPADPELARTRKALAILNCVLQVEPNNPGVAHFIIHATDNPQMASLGLSAARRYAKVAPAAPHALHMPGHIFARLGLWDEVISSNLASEKAAEQPSLLHTEAQNRLHAMEFLQYAYLQTGQDAKAADVARNAATISLADFGPGFRQYWPLKEAGFPARQMLETRDWSAALTLVPYSDSDRLAQQIVFWAQAIAAGHLRNALAAERSLAAYEATLSSSDLNAMKAHPRAQWAEVKAWTLFAEGKDDSAVDLLRPVANLQDHVGKGETELPAREMMGDMLRLGGRSGDAIREYRLSLIADPGRLNTLLHAGEVAAMLGLKSEASTYYRMLRVNTQHASPLSFEALAPARSYRAANIR